MRKKRGPLEKAFMTRVHLEELFIQEIDLKFVENPLKNLITN
jgi:hypothetical protein